MLHTGWGSERWIDEQALGRAISLTASTSPSALLLGSLDAARRLAAVHGRTLLERTLEALEPVRKALRRLPWVKVLDESLVGQPRALRTIRMRMVSGGGVALPAGNPRARCLLGERLSGFQQAGIAAAMGGVLPISVA